MNTPSISVIVPAYNAELTIARAIDSVLKQTVQAGEIIVVDDGSQDNLAAVVQRYGESVRLIQQANARTAAARNRGLDHATGDWIAFLDADDFWEPSKLERQLAVIHRFPQVSVVAGRSYCQQPCKRRHVVPSKLQWYDRVLTPTDATAFLLGTMLWTGTVLVRATALADERFVTGLEPAEDRDLWIRLVSNHPTYLLSEPLATAVLQPGGISRSNIARDCTKMLEVIDRNQHLLGLSSRFFWKSYVRYRWAAIEPAAQTALPLLLRSFIGWPAPFTGLPAMRPWGRLRRLVYLLRHGWRGERLETPMRAAS